jgi:hypothetical protein
VNTVGSLNWGKSLTGALVSSYSDFVAAVAEVRMPAGHDPNATWSNVAHWLKVESILSTTDTSEPSEEIDGNPTASIAALATLGIVPLAVTQVSCASFDFTTEDPTAAAYWAERWCAAALGASMSAQPADLHHRLLLRRELYKHQYVLSRYTWLRGITKIECAA